jgi:hypothetical protein
MGLRRRAVLRAGLGGGLLWAARAHGNAPPATTTTAAPAEVTANLPGARLQGQGRLRFLGFLVYDARLWAPAATPGQKSDTWPQTTLALEIQYARALDGGQIAERSLVEMRRQGDIAPATAATWLAELQRLIPDVVAGDRLTAVYEPGQRLRLFANGTLRGQTTDANLAQRFVGIWLAPVTSEPALRAALLGPTPP